jgi:hypothetical protein
MQARFPMRMANKGEGWREHCYSQHGIAYSVTGDRQLRSLHKAAHDRQESHAQGHSHNWLHGIWRDA